MLLETLEDAGIDAPGLCQACGIDGSLLEDPMGRIPRSRVVRLWEETARRLPDPNLGLHLGERVRPRAANVVTYLMMSSRTLREGLERLVRYQRILGGGSRLKLVEDGENGFVRVEFGSDELPATRDEIEYWTVLLLKYGRWITDLDLGLVEVRFSYPAPPDTREHQRIFGCPLRFDAPEGGLVIESAELDRASVHANPEIARAHEEFAQEYLAGLEDFTTTRKLRELLLAVLDQGPLNLPSVARRLHVSMRTLQRRLRDEDTSYREVVDELRRDVALDRLCKTAAPIQEVAYLTGFAALSPFYRAFRRWTGKTPHEYRVTETLS